MKKLLTTAFLSVLAITLVFAQGQDKSNALVLPAPPRAVSTV